MLLQHITGVTTAVSLNQTSAILMCREKSGTDYQENQTIALAAGGRGLLTYR
jgi:hypothetical protein